MYIMCIYIYIYTYIYTYIDRVGHKSHSAKVTPNPLQQLQYWLLKALEEDLIHNNDPCPPPRSTKISLPLNYKPNHIHSSTKPLVTFTPRNTEKM